MSAPPPSRAGAGGTARVVEKALDVLFSLAAAEAGLGVTELSRQLGLGKSTVHRLLRTLQLRNVVSRDPVSRRYRLSFGVLHLSSAFLRHLNIHDQALPHLRRLRDATGETASLTIREGTTRFHLQELPGLHEVKFSLEIGKSLPLLLGASGKALVAWLGDNEIDELISSCGLPACTPYSITEPGLYKRDLERTRERGFAISESERFVDVISVAAPIRGYSGGVDAAFNVTGPSTRFTREKAYEAGPVLVQEASQLSLSLGWSGEIGSSQVA